MVVSWFLSVLDFLNILIMPVDALTPRKCNVIIIATCEAGSGFVRVPEQASAKGIR